MGTNIAPEESSIKALLAGNRDFPVMMMAAMPIGASDYVAHFPIKFSEPIFQRIFLEF